MPNKESIEKYLEKKFMDWCKENNVEAVKGPAAMYKGIPDRIVIIPNGGGTLWVEFKGDSYYQLTPMQKRWKKILQDSDPKRYFCINTKPELDLLINICRYLMNGGKI